MSGCIALIVGAGRGHRFGSELPKQYCQIGGKTVIGLTLDAFASHPEIDAVRAVIHPDDRELYDYAASSVSTDKLLDPVNGGETRQQSVYMGLKSLVEIAPDRVLIHDAARPFVGESVISRVILALDESIGAIPALPVNDTLKRGQNGMIQTTVARDDLWRAQTPQGFLFPDILEAHRYCAEDTTDVELTDDAAVAERAGIFVKIVNGEEGNIKVTTQEDLIRAGRISGGGEVRIGFGFDVHRFTEGANVTLCGVVIPHGAALAGHSDADVGLHALTDALLGTIGEGDIGSHFPPEETQWKGSPSDVFVSKAVQLITAKGAKIVNVDVTIICEMPKISPYRPAMRAYIAGLLGISEDRVSVKATTTEQLGFAGRGEGIAAQAIANITL